MRDYAGRVDTIRVDLEHLPELREVLYTTPKKAKFTGDDEQVLAELVLAR